MRLVYLLGLWFVIALVAEGLLSVFLNDRTPLDSIGRILAVVLILQVIHSFSALSIQNYAPSFKDLSIYTLVMVASFLIAFMGQLLIHSVGIYLQQLELPGIAAFGIRVEPLTMSYAIPFAAGAILIQSILGAELGLIFALQLSMIIGLFSQRPLMIIPFIIVTSLVGSLSMVKFRSRSAYMKSGLNVSIVAVLFAFCFILIDGQQLEIVNMLVVILSAVMGGILCSFIVGGVVPVLEYLGGYATDISLLEIATLDHPLLKELSITAPGTWNHSMVMGMMGEQAAESIGANAVVCRVGAYFHDIGKTKNPLYFVENQERGENRHDKLSPSMSALIIRSHVKDGIKMAREHKLPKVIEDMIPQHHGTSVIEFFYEKATKESQESGTAQEIDKSLYSYPGPKPQTKEAGILMLADGVEAATRTLAEPTMDRIQGLVQKMINKSFSSGQLAECELTLKDLHSIARCFTRVLTGIHHQRIAYPEPAQKVREKTEEQKEASSEADAKKAAKKRSASDKPEMAESVVDEKASSSDDAEKKPKSTKPEDLKRLGL